MTQPLTQAETNVLATATMLYPAGFTLDEVRTEQRATCEGLVERGSLISIEGVDGGYRLSLKAAEAQRALTALQAERATLNRCLSKSASTVALCTHLPRGLRAGVALATERRSASDPAAAEPRARERPMTASAGA